MTLLSDPPVREGRQNGFGDESAPHRSHPPDRRLRKNPFRFIAGKLSAFGQAIHDTPANMRRYKDGPFIDLDAEFEQVDALNLPAPNEGFPRLEAGDWSLRHGKERREAQRYYKNGPRENGIAWAFEPDTILLDGVPAHSIQGYRSQHPNLTKLYRTLNAVSPIIPFRGPRMARFWANHNKTRNSVVSSVLIVAGLVTAGTASIEGLAALGAIGAAKLSSTLIDERNYHADNLMTDNHQPNAADAAAAKAHGKMEVDFIGDSLLSGVGVSRKIYRQSVDPTHTATFWGGCFVPKGANPEELLVGRSEQLVGVNYACSGQDMPAMIQEQVPMIAKDAALVIMDGGANDAGIISKAKDCSSIVSPDAKRCSTSVIPALKAAEPLVAKHLDDMLKAVHVQAPLAQEMVVGVTDSLPDSSTVFCGFIDTANLAALHAYIAEFNAMEKQVAEKAGAIFFDPNPSFVGHKACTPNSYFADPTLANWVVRAGDNGGALLHPDNYATMVSDMINVLNDRTLPNGKTLHFTPETSGALTTDSGSSTPKPTRTVSTTRTTPPLEELAGGALPTKSAEKSPSASTAPSPVATLGLEPLPTSRATPTMTLGN